MCGCRAVDLGGSVEKNFSLKLDKKFLVLKSQLGRWRRKKSARDCESSLGRNSTPNSKFPSTRKSADEVHLRITRLRNHFDPSNAQIEIATMAEYFSEAKTLRPANGTKNSCRHSTNFYEFFFFFFQQLFSSCTLHNFYFFAKIKGNFIRWSTNLQISLIFFSLFAPWLKRTNESFRDLQPTKLKSDWSRT